MSNTQTTNSPTIDSPLTSGNNDSGQVQSNLFYCIIFPNLSCVLTRNAPVGGGCCCAPSSVPGDDVSSQPHAGLQPEDEGQVLDPQVIDNGDKDSTTDDVDDNVNDNESGKDNEAASTPADSDDKATTGFTRPLLHSVSAPAEPEAPQVQATTDNVLDL